VTQVSDKLIEFIHYLADTASEIIVKNFRQQISIDSKLDSSPVTLADREAESEMRRLINLHFPEHGIMGEEFGNENIQNDFVWVLDPIDGTTSFISGRPIFGTLIALLFQGSPEIGLINQPILRERWLGVKGRQTTFNGVTIATRQCLMLGDALLNTTSPDVFSAKKLNHFKMLSRECLSTQYGGDCYGYAMLSSGHTDLIVETDLKPYDFCALIPIVEGAGGRICNWLGNPLKSDSGNDVIAAGDPALADIVVRVLSKSI
tara:strand:- start:14921 stop:15703 length:783 start_codon:yes stop_codon:yes gene_type:complete